MNLSKFEIHQFQFRIMKKLKNFMFIPNESKLCSETKDAQILEKIDNKEKKKLIVFARKHIPVTIVDIESTSLMKNKFKIEIWKQYVTTYMENLRKESQYRLIMYKHLNRFDILNHLTKIHQSFTINSYDHRLRTDWDQFMKKKKEGSSLILWSDNSRDFLVRKPSSITCQYDLVESEDIMNKDILKFPFKSIAINMDSSNKIGHHADDVQTNTSKFSSCLKEILDEDGDKSATPRKDALFGILRTFKSCPAVVEKKKFFYKPSSKKNESKVLVLSCQNFVKFKKTFTRLLAKNKLRTVEPLLQNLKNPDQIMTKLERALVNHNSRIKNNDNNIMKKNVIILSSEIIENIQLDLNKENEEINTNINNPILNVKSVNSEISDGNSRGTKKMDNILIVNDEIFKDETADEWDRNSSDIDEEKKCKVIYLNHAVFKDLKRDVINKILNRKYTSFRNQTIEKSPKNSVGKNCSKYRDIPIDHMIAAVAETKHSEYVQRSKLSWQVFEKLGEILKKAEILDFISIQNESDQNSDKDIKQKIDESLSCYTPTSYNIHKCEKSKRKKKVKSIEECGCDVIYDRSDGIINAQPNIGIAKSENIFERKIREHKSNSKSNENKKEGKLFEIKAKNEKKLMKDKNRIEMEMSKKKKKKQDEIVVGSPSRQMSNISSKKKIFIGNSKEEFKNTKKIDDLGFSEKRNSQAKFCVKNNKKSSISSSCKEYITDSTEKTKKKIKKLSNLIDRHSSKGKDLNSKDLADDTETKLVVDELLATSFSPKYDKKDQNLVKSRSKIPILGTPTTIRRYIEKVATIAFASRDIREKLKIKKLPEEVRKLEMEKARNKTKQRVEKVESNVKSSKIQESLSNYEKNKKGNSKIRQNLEFKNIRKGNEILQIDEILALNSRSIVNKENENMSRKNESTKKKRNAKGIGVIEQNLDSIKISDIAHNEKISEEKNSPKSQNIKSENEETEKNSPKSQNIKSENEETEKLEEMKKLSDKDYPESTEGEYKISSQMNSSESREVKKDSIISLNLKNIIVNNNNNSEFTVGYELDKITREGMIQQESGKKISMLICNEGNYQSKDESNEKLKSVTMKKDESVISMEKIEYFIRDHEETESFSVIDKVKLSKDMRKRKDSSHILNGVYQNKCTEQEKLNETHNKIIEHNERKENKNYESQNITLTELEIIRRKRLVYFGDFMKNKSSSKYEERNYSFDPQDETNPNEIASMKNSTPDLKDKNENGMLKNDNHNETINKIDRDINTKNQYKNGTIVMKIESELCETETTGNHKISEKSEDDNVIFIKATKSASKEKFGSLQDITKSSLKQIQSNINFIMEYPKKYKEITVKLKRSQYEFERNVSTVMHAICQEAERLKKKHYEFGIVTKKSRELLNKFTNTSSKKRPTFKHNHKFRSNLVDKMTSKIKLFKESTIDNFKTQMNFCNAKRKSMKKKVKCNFRKKRIEEQSSPSLSISNIQTRSIGSLFADLVASALTKCGNTIISKYSDSNDKLTSKTINRNVDTITTVEESEWFIRNDEENLIQKKNEFLEDNEMRKVKFHNSLESNNLTSVEKCEDYGKFQSLSEKNLQTEKISSSTGVNELPNDEEKNVCFPLLYLSGEKTILQEEQFQTSENTLTKQDGKKSIYLQKLMLGETSKNIDEFNTLIKNDDMSYLRSYKDVCLVGPNEYNMDSNIAIRKAECFISNPSLEPDNLNQLPESGKPLIEKLTNIRTNLESQTEENKHTQERCISIFEESDEKTIPSVYNISINSKHCGFNPKSSRSFQEIFTDITSAQNSNITNICTSHISNNWNLSEFKPTKLQKPEMGFEISNEICSNGAQENLTRKDEIELTCKFSDHPNSLVCRERKQNEVRSVLRKCVSLDKTAQKVLKNSYKFENITEMFMDLEQMGNSILKSIFPKNEIPNNDCIERRIPIDSRKKLISKNSRDCYTSSREKEHMELLIGIRNEVLENEEFFDAENNDYDVIHKNAAANNKEMRKNSKMFIYENIIQSSNVNRESQWIPKKEMNKTREGHVLTIDPEENQSNRTTESDLNNNRYLREYKSAIIINDIVDTSQILIQKDSFILASENILEEEGKNCPNNSPKKIIFEVNTERNSEENNSIANRKQKDKENEFLHEITEDSQLLLTNNNIETKTMKVLSENPYLNNEKKYETSKIRNEKISNKTKKHEISEKFARITQHQNESVFKITGLVQFDRTKKQISQHNNVARSLRKNILTERKQEREEKNIRIGKYSLTSKEAWSPLDTKNSDTDLKNLLLQNPKKLIEIASSIMSKSQYLSFLLDLKSTKDLKSHWVDKIKKGIFRTVNISESTKKVDNFGRECDGNIHTRNRKNEILSVKAMSPTKKQCTASNKSNFGEDKKKIHLDIENFRTMESHLSSRFDCRGNKKESSSGQNSNIENEYSWNYSENDPLPYSLMRYLDIPFQKNHVDETEKYKSSDQLIANSYEIGKVRNEKSKNDEDNNSAKEQTSIDKPGKEAIKISLINDEVFKSPASSIKDKSKRIVNEKVSNGLSNCSGSVSLVCSEEVCSSTASKSDNESNKDEILQPNVLSESSIYTQSLHKVLQELPTASQNTDMNKKILKEPLKKKIGNHDNSYPSNVTEDLPTIENTDVSCNCLNDERKIRVVSTKSLSKVLEEDPDLLKRLGQKKKMIKQDTPGEPTRKFEYRFHDFRKTEDRCEQLKARRQQEHKKVLSDKFKCLIQARKVATERNKQKLRTNENQQIKPKDFSKILEKINYFQDLEIRSNSDIKAETIEKDHNSVSTKKKKILCKKRKKINEDELVTWVQNHPAVPVKPIATEIVGKCDIEKQNVIHIPWMSTCEVNAKN